jgi:c(7)-type cytochrome triheme protein
MRLTTLLVMAAIGALILSPIATAPAHAQKVPADFSIEGAKDSPGPVTFSHEKHKAAGIEKCNACHTKVFKMKKGGTGPFTMEKMKAGEACGSCHDGKTKTGDKVAFSVDDKSKCESCHKKK